MCMLKPSLGNTLSQGQLNHIVPDYTQIPIYLPILKNIQSHLYSVNGVINTELSWANTTNVKNMHLHN